MRPRTTPAICIADSEYLRRRIELRPDDFWAFRKPQRSKISTGCGRNRLPCEIPAGVDFGQVILKPGADIFLAFVQDLDQDGLFAWEEYMSGSTDSRADVLDNALFGEDFDESQPQIPDDRPDSGDTDRDGLGDFAEVRVGWKVSADGGRLCQVFTSPQPWDSDGVGSLDPVQQHLPSSHTPNAPCDDALCAFQSEPPFAFGDAVAIIAGPN